MIFYTYDSDGTEIYPEARILEAYSPEEAFADLVREHFRSQEGSFRGSPCADIDTPQVCFRLEKGHWVDCWIKTPRDVREDEAYRDEWFGRGERRALDGSFPPARDCECLAPGQHPGGQAYWYTPWDDVYILTPTDFYR